MNYKKITIIALCMGMFTIVPSGRDTQSCNVICVGGSNISCKKNEAKCTGGKSSVPGLNAAGERIQWPKLPPVEEENWGTITVNKEVTLIFPPIGSYKLISFTPTEGPQQDQRIQILIASFSLDDIPTAVPSNVQKELNALKKSDEPFNNVIKLYRKVGNERSWLDMKEILTNSDPNSEKMHVEVIIQQNGILRTAKDLIETDANDNEINSGEIAIDLASYG